MELILDLDSLLYKAGFSVEKRIRHVMKGREEVANFQYAKDLKEFLATREDADELEVKEQHWVDSEESALKLLDVLLYQIQEALPHDDFTMYLGGTNNFRYELYPEYKANRAKANRPVHLKALEQYAIDRGGLVPEGMEADDAVCIHAWECLNGGRDFIVAAIDKDLDQIPGTRFNYGTMSRPYEITPYQADLSFYSQLLMGDTSDNIPGLRGIGKARAPIMLAECNDEREMYEVCKEKWGNDDMMYLSAKLLYLLRSKDDEYEPPI